MMTVIHGMDASKLWVYLIFLQEQQDRKYFHKCKLHLVNVMGILKDIMSTKNK